MKWPHGKAAVRGILEGSERAVALYEDWTGGSPLGRAPESLLQVEIARALRQVYPYVTLETRVIELLTYGRAEWRGALPRSGSGRIDVVLWSASGLLRILIEVKKASSVQGITSDVRRLRQLAQRCGTVRRGILAVFTSAQSPEVVEERLHFFAALPGSRFLGQTEHGLRNPNLVDRYWSVGVINVKP